MFGNLLMGGNLFIGLIVFAIIMIVNFVVVTKGSARIAEVSARFFLDSLPGKQMAIDGELNSGILDATEAHAKRRNLEAEGGFYGSMDGASKFIRGDAIAGMCILFVNIIAGLLIGVFGQKMSISDAASVFTTLTIGDGLVSQLPSLIVSVSAGIIVTKGDQGNSAADDRSGDTTLTPLIIAIGVCVFLLVLPGVPFFPFFVILLPLLSLFFFFRNKHANSVDKNKIQPSINEKNTSILRDELGIDPIRLELGLDLLQIVNDSVGHLAKQMQTIRHNFNEECGIKIPQIRIQDNVSLKPRFYRINIREITSGEGELYPNHFLVMDPTGRVPEMEGIEAREPAFGIKALWIKSDLRELAISKNYTIVDSTSVIITHMVEVIRRNILELFSTTDLKNLIDSSSDDIKNIFSDVVPALFPVSVIHRIFSNLLSENVSIRDKYLIIESIQEAYYIGKKDSSDITEFVRMRLSRQICSSLINLDQYISVVTVSAEIELALLENSGVLLNGVQQSKLPPISFNSLVEKITNFLSKFRSDSGEITLVVNGSIRRKVLSMVRALDRKVNVVSYDEISGNGNIKKVAEIS
ncbi:flagellar biosynthesis protein FlhA [Neoasaia chiangmaiensis NBRC 101099]|nr:flagellar biosynthesis protein FlhA [Neoasaia chiangmaiensis NBRC 101099]GEN13936.1 flagellar biosynthesis protein FlhA [Neoasaia chiangmaiensis]